MATYLGIRKAATATDLFPSSIDGNWTNGDGAWAAMAWVSGGYVEGTSTSVNSGMRRTGESYADDQWCQAEVQVHTGTDSELGVAVRAKAGTDESCYMGKIDTSPDEYQIQEVDDAFTFTFLVQVADPDTTLPASAGDILTIEVVGPTIRFLSDGSGAETEYAVASDNTLASGDPLLRVKANTGVADARFTAWSAGDMDAWKITTDLVIISTAESTSNWSGVGSGPGAALEPDFNVQGSNCISRAVSNAKKGVMFDFGTGIDFTTGTHKDKLVYIWVRCNTPQATAIRANGGVAIRLSSTSATANWREWYVAGKDTLPDNQGWICYVIDPQSAGSADTGTYVATGVQFFGAILDTTVAAAGQNLGVDQIMYGRGELYVQGPEETVGEGFKAIAATVYDPLADNRWGIITVEEGVIYVKGKIIFGHASEDLTLSSRGELVVWETPAYDDGTNIVKTIPDASVGGTNGADGNTSYNGLAFRGGTGTTTIDLGVKVGSDKGRSGSTLLCPANADLSTPGRTLATVAASDDTIALSLYASTFKGFEGQIDLRGTGL